MAGSCLLSQHKHGACGSWIMCKCDHSNSSLRLWTPFTTCDALFCSRLFLYVGAAVLVITFMFPLPPWCSVSLKNIFHSYLDRWLTNKNGEETKWKKIERQTEKEKASQKDWSWNEKLQKRWQKHTKKKRKKIKQSKRTTE